MNESEAHHYVLRGAVSRLTVSVFGADLGDDLHVFLHLSLEGLLSDSSAVESIDKSPELFDVRHPPPSCQHL